MSGGKFAEDYVDVATRLAGFRGKYPEGSLQPFDPAEPVKVVTVGDRVHLQYIACAYRTPDDPRPGIGIAWEPFPGRTPYTKDSEAMVAETSAWGRAIVAALAGDTKRGIASAEEVRNRAPAQAESADPPPDPRVGLINEIATLAKATGVGQQAVLEKWAADHDGQHIREATDMAALMAVRDDLKAIDAHE